MVQLAVDSSASYSLRCYDCIRDLPVTFNTLFNNAAHSFFITRNWFEILEEATHTEQDRFFYLTLETDSEAVALMALRTPAGQLGSSLEGQNTGPGSIASLTNWYCCLYDCLISPSVSDRYRVIRTLVTGLKKQLGKGAVIEFNYLDQRADTTDFLVRALRSAGFIAWKYHHTLVRYEVVRNMDFESYLAQRSPGIRREYARKGRRLAEKFQLEQLVYSDDRELGKVIADFQQIYAKCWKRPERFPQFIPALLKLGLAERQLRVAMLYLDGQPVASELYTLFNGQATSYKGGYDPAFKKYSPASVLRIFTIKHLMEVDNVSEIDFGYGDHPYKKSWLNQSRWLMGVLAFNPRSLTGWKLLLRRIHKNLRSKVRQLKRRLAKTV